MKLIRSAMLAAAPVFVSVALASAVQAADAAPDAKAAFERMKTLVGVWQGHHTKPDGPAMEVDYRLTSNGTALVERLFAGSPHEMTSVYHLEGSELVITHYCAMGNQPRMKLVAGGKDGDLRFDFVDGANLDPTKSTHIHGGRISTPAPDRFDADWYVWSQGKQSDTHRLFMKRAAPAK
jgi:hypothetical protein